MIDGWWGWQVVTLACGGYAAFNGHITAEQLTSFVLYIEFVTAASIAVGEQYAAVMEVTSPDPVQSLLWLNRPPPVVKNHIYILAA
eukprot:scaffold93719_cov38-Prasinocladus_malaysianus.AAC.1